MQGGKGTLGAAHSLGSAPKPAVLLVKPWMNAARYEFKGKKFPGKLSSSSLFAVFSSGLNAAVPPGLRSGQRFGFVQYLLSWPACSEGGL